MSVIKELTWQKCSMTKFEPCWRHAIYMMSLFRMSQTFLCTIVLSRHCGGTSIWLKTDSVQIDIPDSNRGLISMDNIWCCITHHTRTSAAFISSMTIEWHSWAKSLMNSFWFLGLTYVVLCFLFDFECIHAFSVGLCLLIRFKIWTKFESSLLSPLKAKPCLSSQCSHDIKQHYHDFFFFQIYSSPSSPLLNNRSTCSFEL